MLWISQAAGKVCVINACFPLLPRISDHPSESDLGVVTFVAKITGSIRLSDALSALSDALSVRLQANTRASQSTYLQESESKYSLVSFNLLNALFEIVD